MSKEPGLVPDPDLGLPGPEEPMPEVEEYEPTQINDEEEL